MLPIFGKAVPIKVHSYGLLQQAWQVVNVTIVSCLQCASAHREFDALLFANVVIGYFVDAAAAAIGESAANCDVAEDVCVAMERPRNGQDVGRMLPQGSALHLF